MLRGNSQSPAARHDKGRWALFLWFLLLLLSSLACNAFAGNLEPFPEPPSLTRTAVEVTASPVMAATVTVDADQGRGSPSVSTLVDLNVRNGPGVQYDRIGFLSEGTTVAVEGIDPQSGWLKIPCPELVDGDECWVSGGSQYVAAANIAEVPTAVAPATPTTIPPTLEAGRGWLAYLDDGQLYVAALDVSQHPVRLAGEGKAVSSGAGVERFAFSGDGRRLAYVAGNGQVNNLYVVHVDGGDQRTLVTSSILPTAGMDGQTVTINELQWLPDDSGVAFNTRLVNTLGTGAGTQDDLWTVSLDGELVEQFAAGQGGGHFLLQADGEILLSRSDEIVRAQFGTEEQERLLAFEAINTASESAYYPELQDAGTGAYVAVPASEPLLPGSRTRLWYIPPARPAVELGHVTDASLQQPVMWSADGAQLAYLQRPVSQEDGLPFLVVAAGDGTGATPYAGGPEMRFLVWGQADNQFLYADRGYYALGRPQAPPQQLLLPAGQSAGEAIWASNRDYVIGLDDPVNGQWEIRSADTMGESLTLLRGQGLRATFALWQP